MTSPSALPPLETGTQGFLSGWLHTTRDVMLSPRRFFSSIGPGPLALPLRFALLSVTPALLLNEVHALISGSTTLGALTLLRIPLSPFFAVAMQVVLPALLWITTCRLFGARVPRSVALRAFAYLSAIASTIGIPMTIAGFAPESGPPVVFWYVALIAAYFFITYATYRLARSPYQLGPIKSVLAVSVFQLACALTTILAVAIYVKAGGTDSRPTDSATPDPELQQPEAQTDE